MLLDRLSNLPQAVQDTFPMVRLYVVVFFVCDQLHHSAAALLRYGAVNELVQNREHFVPAHGTAFQQNLAHSQDFTVTQALGQIIHQPVAPQFVVIDNILSQGLIGNETP